jgi:hypothetical protein
MSYRGEVGLVQCEEHCAAFRQHKKVIGGGAGKEHTEITEYCAMMPDGRNVGASVDSLYTALDDLRTSIMQSADEQTEKLRDQLVSLEIGLTNINGA